MPSTSTLKSDNAHICPHKYAFMLDNFMRKLFQNPTKIVGAYIQPGDTVIDLGCGPGFFTIDMARMVGESGRVIAVDLQAAMLESVRKKASKYGVSSRINYHQCGPTSIGLNQKAAFILAMYMVHETPDQRAFLSEVKALLQDSGKFLIVEPGLHVNRKEFDAMVKDAEAIGFTAIDFPRKKGGKSVLLSLMR